MSVTLIPIDIGPSLVEIAELDQLAVERGLDLLAEQVKADYEKTTATWKQRPAFDVQKEPNERLIGTDDQTYAWVNDGTAAHFISPRTKRALRFASNVTPKTIPLSLDSQAGSRENDVYATRVFNPGVEPRKFDQAVFDKYEPIAAEIIQQELNKS